MSAPKGRSTRYRFRHLHFIGRTREPVLDGDGIAVGVSLFFKWMDALYGITIPIQPVPRQVCSFNMSLVFNFMSRHFLILPDVVPPFKSDSSVFWPRFIFDRGRARQIRCFPKLGRTFLCNGDPSRARLAGAAAPILTNQAVRQQPGPASILLGAWRKSDPPVYLSATARSPMAGCGNIPGTS